MSICNHVVVTESRIGIQKNAVWGAMQDLPWRNIWSPDPFEVLNEHLSLLVGRYVSKVIRVSNKVEH